MGTTLRLLAGRGGWCRGRSFFADVRHHEKFSHEFSLERAGMAQKAAANNHLTEPLREGKTQTRHKHTGETQLPLVYPYVFSTTPPTYPPHATGLFPV